MSKTPYLLSVILTLLISGYQVEIVRAQNNDGTLEHVGTSVANYLKVGVGARASSMGGAYVALSDDITSLYWNPGGIGMVDHNEAVFSITDWFMDTKMYFFAASYNVEKFGIIGLSINSFTSGDIEETTVDQPEGTGRSFSASNHTIGLTYSKRLIDRFSMGITLKYIQENLDRTTGSAFAIDVGSIFITNFFNDMRIGFAMSNLGEQMHFSGSDLEFQVSRGQEGKPVQVSYLTQSWNLPLMFRFGLATELFDTDLYRLTVSGEVFDSRDFKYRIHSGAEFAFNEMVFLRGGYKFNYEITDFSIGGGIVLPSYQDLGIRFDYSYENHTYFGGIQKISAFITY
jgi:hypothetical protein